MEIRDEKAFVKDKKIAFLGCINGILLYTLVWAELVKFCMQLVLGDNYKTFVTEKESFALLICMCIAVLLTMITSIFIAKPENIINSFANCCGGSFRFNICQPWYELV